MLILRLAACMQLMCSWKNRLFPRRLIRTAGKNWVSGELFTYYRDWLLEECRETVFDCRSGGIGHKHCMDTVFARKLPENGGKENGGF